MTEVDGESAPVTVRFILILCSMSFIAGIYLLAIERDGAQIVAFIAYVLAACLLFILLRNLWRGGRPISWAALVILVAFAFGRTIVTPDTRDAGILEWTSLLFGGLLLALLLAPQTVSWARKRRPPAL